MRIGIPGELKNNEYRVGATPASAQAYLAAGHTVLVQSGAGEGSGYSDEEYAQVGATVVTQAEDAWAADMVVKVKEPLPEEYRYFRKGLILFTYLHLAPEPELTQALLTNQVSAVAYETIQSANGLLPLLSPMSEIAGRMSVQIGARFLEKSNGGRGVLLGGVPGVLPCKAVIVGGGIAGSNAARMAVGLGADVTVIDLNADRLRQLDDQYQGRIRTVMSNPLNIAEAVKQADLLIGAVLVPGAKAPKIVKEEMVAAMKPGSVIVDIAIDQGGSIETIDRVTTHDDPVYTKHGVIHYAVANMPGAVPRTSTIALTNVTTPYGLQLAGKGCLTACRENPALMNGLNTYDGKVTHRAVAESLELPFHQI